MGPNVPDVPSSRKRPQQKRRPTGGRTTPPQTRAGRKAETPGQVGKRPSSPLFLSLVGVLWIACGVVDLFWLKASWKLVPAIFFIGVGLYFLRGAAATVVRRENRR